MAKSGTTWSIQEPSGSFYEVNGAAAALDCLGAPDTWESEFAWVGTEEDAEVREGAMADFVERLKWSVQKGVTWMAVCADPGGSGNALSVFIDSETRKAQVMSCDCEGRETALTGELQLTDKKSLGDLLRAVQKAMTGQGAGADLDTVAERLTWVPR